MNQDTRTPGSMLEIYMEAISNETGDPFLDSINLGVGNYTNAEYWQQMDAFRQGIYADSAMTEKIIQRAVLETKKAMVDAIFENEGSELLEHVEHPDPDGRSKREYLEEEMDDVWESLGYAVGEETYSKSEHKAWLVNTCTGLAMDWTPPHWRMLKAKHEGSRSKSARLLDNVFGRPPEPDPQPMEDFR